MRFGKDVYIMGLICVLGILVIFGLSWVPNPNLRELELLPSWLTNWTDDYGNSRIRTAIPFLLLSLLVGAWLLLKRYALVGYIMTWVLFTGIVVMAELGQYFIPLRDVDVKDIFWGSMGSFFGLGCMYVMHLMLRILK